MPTYPADQPRVISRAAVLAACRLLGLDPNDILFLNVWPDSVSGVGFYRNEDGQKRLTGVDGTGYQKVAVNLGVGSPDNLTDEQVAEVDALAERLNTDTKPVGWLAELREQKESDQ